MFQDKQEMADTSGILPDFGGHCRRSGGGSSAKRYLSWMVVTKATWATAKSRCSHGYLAIIKNKATNDMVAGYYGEEYIIYVKYTETILKTQREMPAL